MIPEIRVIPQLSSIFIRVASANMRAVSHIVTHSTTNAQRTITRMAHVGKPGPPSTNVIEVERKFMFTAESEQKLREMGGEMIKAQSFRDVYFDTNDLKLALSDYWLRQRDGQWQLKCPPPSRREGDPMATQYAEYDDQVDIVKALTPVLQPAKDEREPLKAVNPDLMSVSQVVESFGCCEIASYRTDRKSYSVQEFRVDLDCADFGFQVGEIELLVSDERKLSDALHQIRGLAQKLGVANVEKLPGKVSIYLWKYNKGAYDQLLKKHAITPIDNLPDDILENHPLFKD